MKEKITNAFSGNLFTCVHCYNSTDSFWDYYYSLTGFFNDSYFAITFQSRDQKETIEISPLTECKDELLTYLKKFGL